MTDLHIHTKYSDGRHSLRYIVDLYGRLGFDAIAITDHLCENHSFLGRAAHLFEKSLNASNFDKYIAAIDEEAERAWDLYQMRVIPGVEITKNSIEQSQSAHVLALGIREYISPDQSVQDLCREIKNQGGLSVAAHPVSTKKFERQTYYLWNHRRELESHFDAWEVASGPKYFGEVAESHLRKIATSDLHDSSQIHSWKTLIDAENHTEAIFESVRKQKVSFKFFNSVS